jgi:hypothetical protein
MTLDTVENTGTLQIPGLVLRYQQYFVDHGVVGNQCPHEDLGATLLEQRHCKGLYDSHRINEMLEPIRPAARGDG